MYRIFTRFIGSELESVGLAGPLAEDPFGLRSVEEWEVELASEPSRLVHSLELVTIRGLDRGMGPGRVPVMDLDRLQVIDHAEPRVARWSAWLNQPES